MKHDHTLNNEKHELTVNELDAVAGGHFHVAREHFARFSAANKSSSIANSNDDTPLNWLGLFNSSNTSN
jgi:hypothetical protein